MAIKLLDPTARFDVFSAYDDAIDGQSETGDKAFQKYMDTLNPADLIRKDGTGEPTAFVVKPLLSTQTAALQEKHLAYDVAKKKLEYRYGYSAYLLDVFGIACEGIRLADGSVQKVNADEVGLTNALSVASSAIMITAVSKNLKNA